MTWGTAIDEDLIDTPSGSRRDLSDLISRPEQICSGKPLDWVEDARRQLQVIARLPENWDSNGAPMPDRAILQSADALLMALLSSVAIPRPHINPTPGGGVQFEWDAGRCYFEIEFVSRSAASYFFQDDQSHTEIDGEIFVGENIGPLLKYLRRVEPNG